jgi:hypothetical protein
MSYEQKREKDSRRLGLRLLLLTLEGTKTYSFPCVIISERRKMLGRIFGCCCCRRRKKQVVINDTIVSVYSRQDASSLIDTPPASPVPASSPAIQPAAEKTSVDSLPLVVELPAVAVDSRIAGSLVASISPTDVKTNGATTSSLASLFV